MNWKYQDDESAGKPEENMKPDFKALASQLAMVETDRSFAIEKALTAAYASGLEDAAKIAEDSCLNDIPIDDKWRLACNKEQKVNGKEPYIVCDIENGYDEATFQIARAIRSIKPGANK